MDPTYALAYAGLADTYSYQGYAFGRLPPKEAIPRAKSLAEQAVQMDDALGEAHSALALAKFLDWDFAGAGPEFEHSIELNPNYPSSHHFYAVFLSEVLGRFDDALVEANKGLQLDPMSLPLNNIVAFLSYESHRWDAALEQYRKFAQIFPNANVHFNLSDCYKHKGTGKEAGQEFLEGMKASGASESRLQAYRRTYTNSGWNGVKLKQTEENVTEWNRNPWHCSAYGIAISYADCGDKNQALQWLQKAYDAHSGMLIWIKTEPALDNLRSDVRFQDLVGRIGFPQ